MTHSEPEGRVRDGVESTSVFTSGLIPPAGGDDEMPADAAVEAAEIPVGGAALLVTRGSNAGSRFALDAAVLTAGRHPDSDIFLDDVSVSRRHAEFRRTEEGFEVVDVGSLNGTYINRESVESASLAAGDEIQIGKFRLVFLQGQAPAAT